MMNQQKLNEAVQQRVAVALAELHIKNIMLASENDLLKEQVAALETIVAKVPKQNENFQKVETEV